MPHTIASQGEYLVAFPDISQPMERAPLVPTSHKVSEAPPVFTIAKTWQGYVQLASTLPGAQLTPEVQAWVADEVRRRVAEAWTANLALLPPLPGDLVPYPWQAQAACQYVRTQSLLLSDDPGTGKTISAVLSVAARWKAHGRTRTLVVTPRSVVSDWLKTWRKWTPDAVVGRYTGTKAKRQQLLDNATDVVVTTYGLLSRDADELKAWLGPGGNLVLDEHHLIKTKDVSRSKAARALADTIHQLGASLQVRGGTIALSGTPISHHPGDLWAPLYCLEPDAMASSSRFQDRYLEVQQGHFADEVVGFLPHRRAEFDLGMAGVHRRVSKADALPWLPPKVYQVREVEMPTEWRKAYNAMRDEMLAELPDSLEPLNAMSALAQLQRLQQLASAAADVTTEPAPDTCTCTHAKARHQTMGEDWGTGETIYGQCEHGGDAMPCLCHGYQEDPEAVRVVVTLRDPSWKVDELLEVLAEREGEQVAVFSPSRQLIRLAAKRLEAEGITYGTVVGGQSDASREHDVQAFQDGKLRCILVTTQAGGVGLTLTAASCAVFLSRPWSGIESSQAEDRVHRIGSERHASVDIVDIVAEDTVDEQVRLRLVEKGEALADVLHDPRVVRELLGGSGVKRSRKTKKITTKEESCPDPVSAAPTYPASSAPATPPSGAAGCPSPTSTEPSTASPSSTFRCSQPSAASGNDSLETSPTATPTPTTSEPLPSSTAGGLELPTPAPEEGTPCAAPTPRASGNASDSPAGVTPAPCVGNPGGLASTSAADHTPGQRQPVLVCSVCGHNDRLERLVRADGGGWRHPYECRVPDVDGAHVVTTPNGGRYVFPTAKAAGRFVAHTTGAHYEGVQA